MPIATTQAEFFAQIASIAEFLPGTWDFSEYNPGSGGWRCELEEPTFKVQISFSPTDMSREPWKRGEWIDVQAYLQPDSPYMKRLPQPRFHPKEQPRFGLRGNETPEEMARVIGRRFLNSHLSPRL